MYLGGQVCSQAPQQYSCYSLPHRGWGYYEYCFSIISVISYMTILCALPVQSTFGYSLRQIAIYKGIDSLCLLKEVSSGTFKSSSLATLQSTVHFKFMPCSHNPACWSSTIWRHSGTMDAGGSYIKHMPPLGHNNMEKDRWRLFSIFFGVTHVIIKPDQWLKLVVPQPSSRCAWKKKEWVKQQSEKSCRLFMVLFI